jgi:hypothetical protein
MQAYTDDEDVELLESCGFRDTGILPGLCHAESGAHPGLIAVVASAA